MKKDFIDGEISKLDTIISELDITESLELYTHLVDLRSKFTSQRLLESTKDPVAVREDFAPIKNSIEEADWWDEVNRAVGLSLDKDKVSHTAEDFDKEVDLSNMRSIVFRNYGLTPDADIGPFITKNIGEDSFGYELEEDSILGYKGEVIFFDITDEYKNKLKITTESARRIRAELGKREFKESNDIDSDKLDNLFDTACKTLEEKMSWDKLYQSREEAIRGTSGELPGLLQMELNKNLDKLPEWYNYDPLPYFLELKKSNIHGYGVFAKTDISLILHTKYITHIVTTHGVLRTPLGGYINHSATPNCEFSKYGDIFYLRLIDKERIKKGDEITVNYHDQEDICKPDNECT